MNKNDLRYVKTEEVIRNTFKNCVKEKGFERTSVVEICEKAKISRNTFYLHYEDKYLLLEKLFAEFEEKFCAYYDAAGLEKMMNYDPSRNTACYVDAVIETKDEMIFLMECSSKLMEKTLYRVAVEYLLKDYVPDYKKWLSRPKIRITVEYAFGALVSFTDYWLHHYDDFTKEEIVESLVKMSQNADRILLESFLH